MNDFNVGDIVKYISGDYGDRPNNPLWDGESGKTKGTVVDIEKYPRYVLYYVKWDNGRTNSYNKDDISLIEREVLPVSLFEL